MIDVAQQIGAVTREVASGERDGAPVKTVVARQTYPSPIEEVWDALTNPERLPRWFLPVSGELTLGGRFQFEGNAGGTVLECEPTTLLLVTWEYGGEVSWVEVRLTAEGQSTTLRLEHTAPMDAERWEEFGPGAIGVGWDSGLLGLALHLRGAAPMELEAKMAWGGSEEGRAFMAASSQDWARAAIADGDGETPARAAASRTTAAYTGVEQHEQHGQTGQHGQLQA
ncbi:MAG: SRPBCC family protein [Actinomycetota bacterium]|nr:SRPBCC family protein [Actinomycetota bacterium]